MKATPGQARRARLKLRRERARREVARRRPHPYHDDPVGFATEVLGLSLWSKQREMLEAIRDNDRVAVSACHGVGKTFTAAIIVLWFLATRGPNCRVITTAPTFDPGVKALLWRAIRGMVADAHAAGRMLEVPTPTSVQLEMGPEWFAAGYSTDQPERFQGHHATHLLFVGDEASGIADDIFNAAEGFLTAEGAKALLIGNPTRTTGTFFSAFHKARDAWTRVTISVFDTPNYTGEQVPAHVARALPRANWAAEKAKQWGKKSVMYAVRVLGQFARTTDRNVIGLGDIEDAQARRIPAVPGVDLAAVISCDVARFGDDNTVIGERVGNVVRVLEVYNGKDTEHTADRVEYWARRHHPLMRIVVVDDSGVGGGVTDKLRRRGIRVEAFNGGGAAMDPSAYPNRRSESWFQTAAVLEFLDLDSDEDLAADLTAPEFSYDSALRRVVEPKKATKKRLGHSPDRGDMVVMACSFPMDRVARAPREQVVAPARPAISAGIKSKGF